MAEQPVISSLLMDRSEPIGNSQDALGRRSLHTLITNGSVAPIYSKIIPLSVLQVTIIPVTDSAWTRLPMSPLANRTSIIIQNTHPKQNLYINYTNAGPLQQGFIIYPEGTREIVVSPAVQIWGCMEVGYSSNVVVEEGSP